MVACSSCWACCNASGVAAAKRWASSGRLTCTPRRMVPGTTEGGALRATAARPSDTEDWAAACPGADTHPSGSSLKFCLLAEGAADAYPRFGPTSEWDTAAADAILRAAGGLTWGEDGAALGYGKPRYLNGSFLALADPAARASYPAFGKG